MTEPQRWDDQHNPPQHSVTPYNLSSIVARGGKPRNDLCCRAYGKFGVSRFSINWAQETWLQKGTHYCGGVVVHVSALVAPVAVLAVV